MPGTVRVAYTEREDTIPDRVAAQGADRQTAHRRFRPDSRGTGLQPGRRRGHRTTSTTGLRTVRAILFHLSRRAALRRERQQGRRTMSTQTGTGMCTGRLTTAGNSARGTTGRIPAWAQTHQGAADRVLSTGMRRHVSAARSGRRAISGAAEDVRSEGEDGVSDTGSGQKVTTKNTETRITQHHREHEENPFLLCPLCSRLNHRLCVLRG